MEYYNVVFNYEATDSKSDDNFNIFNILDIEYDEVRLHSRILKYLIEQDQQGFLEAIAISLPENSNVTKKLHKGNLKVSIEKSINSIEEDLSDGRIDLLLQFDDFTIIIENKLYARDQESQLIKYHNFIKSAIADKSKNSVDFFLILYLTPNGSPPSEYSIKFNDINLEQNKDFFLISYEHNIKKWLNNFEHANNNLKEIIKQYIKTIEKICRIMSKEDKERILRLLGEDKLIQNFEQIKWDIGIIERKIHDFWRDVSEKINVEYNSNKLNTHFKEGSIMFNLFSDERGIINFYLQYKPNFNESPFLSIWLNSKKQKEIESKKSNINGLDFSFNNGYLNIREDKDLFTNDVFKTFVADNNEIKQIHIELINEKIKQYLEENKFYIKTLKENIS